MVHLLSPQTMNDVELALVAPGITEVARALSDLSRLRIVCVLMDGRAYSATMLAMEADIAPSTASAHLGVLVDAGLVRRAVAPPRHGRYRYYELAGPDIAEACEKLAALVPWEPMAASAMPGTSAHDLRTARVCYDHLAGRIGVALMDALTGQDWLAPNDADYALTATGERELARFGIDLLALRRGKRRVIRTCPDCSEQRPHLSGALGGALLAQIERRGWIERSPASRMVTITAAGHEGFRAWFGVETPV